MYRDEIEPLWIQVPIFLPNSISQENPFLVTWEDGVEWMRDKDPISIQSGHVLKEDAEKEAKAGYFLGNENTNNPWAIKTNKYVKNSFDTKEIYDLQGCTENRQTFKNEPKWVEISLK